MHSAQLIRFRRRNFSHGKNKIARKAFYPKLLKPHEDKSTIKIMLWKLKQGKAAILRRQHQVQVSKISSLKGINRHYSIRQIVIDR